MKLAQILEYISKEGSKFVVRSHQTDKSFGTYDTKAEAVKRLQQIKGFAKKGKGIMSPDYAPMPAIGNSNSLFGSPVRRMYPGPDQMEDVNEGGSIIIAPGMKAAVRFWADGHERKESGWTITAVAGGSVDLQKNGKIHTMNVNIFPED